MSTIRIHSQVIQNGFPMDANEADILENEAEEIKILEEKSPLPSPFQAFAKSQAIAEDGKLQKEIFEILKDQAATKDLFLKENITLVKIHQTFSKTLHKQEDELRKKHAEQGTSLENLSTADTVVSATAGIAFVVWAGLTLVTGGVTAAVSTAIVVINVASGALSATHYFYQLKHNEKTGEIKVAQEKRSHHHEKLVPLFEEIKKETAAKANAWKLLRLHADLQKFNS